MEEFNSCIHECGLLDIAMKGHILSWSNKSTRNKIMSRLNKALVNPDWLRQFSDCSGVYQHAFLSDHASMVISRILLIIRSLNLLNSCTAGCKRKILMI